MIGDIRSWQKRLEAQPKAWLVFDCDEGELLGVYDSRAAADVEARFWKTVHSGRTRVQSFPIANLRLALERFCRDDDEVFAETLRIEHGEQAEEA